jgi:hypothetical protein
VATALDNVHKMLRSGGSVVIFSPASNAIDHGFYSFSPTLFFDYFGDNSYSQMSCYLMEGNPWVLDAKCRLFRYAYVGRQLPLVSSQGVGIGFLATKHTDGDSTERIKPIQAIYRRDRWAHEVPEDSTKSARAAILSKAKRLVFRLLDLTRAFCPYFVQRLAYGKHANKGLKFVGRY